MIVENKEDTYCPHCDKYKCLILYDLSGDGECQECGMIKPLDYVNSKEIR